jgi:hypothetical protein
MRNEAVGTGIKELRARGVIERGELRADRIGVGSGPLGTLWIRARREILAQLTPKLQAGRGSCLKITKDCKKNLPNPHLSALILLPSLDPDFPLK